MTSQGRKCLINQLVFLTSNGLKCPQLDSCDFDLLLIFEFSRQKSCSFCNFRRPQTASDGLKWPLKSLKMSRKHFQESFEFLASNGLKWSQMASNGLKWPQMTSNDLIWHWLNGLLLVFEFPARNYFKSLVEISGLKICSCSLKDLVVIFVQWLHFCAKCVKACSFGSGSKVLWGICCSATLDPSFLQLLLPLRP